MARGRTANLQPEVKFTLIRTTGPMPPGGFVFHDPITGAQYHDLHTRFDERVRQIITNRKANHRLFTDESRVDSTHVARELSEQICQRLNNHPKYCSNGLPRVSSNFRVTAAPQPAVKGCRYCGSDKLTEVVCPTCLGHKVVGYKCQSCGKESPK